MTNKPEMPKIIVGVLIYNDKGEVFLGSCPKWKGLWIVPGGHLELGETLHHCVAREVKEETNLDIDKFDLVDIQESIFSEEYHEKRHMIFIDFSAKAKEGEIILNNEFTEYKWLNPEESLKLNLNESTRRFIEKYIEKLNGKYQKII